MWHYNPNDSKCACKHGTWVAKLSLHYDLTTLTYTELEHAHACSPPISPVVPRPLSRVERGLGTRLSADQNARKDNLMERCYAATGYKIVDGCNLIGLRENKTAELARTE